MLDRGGADVTDRVEVLVELEEKRLEKRLAGFSHLRGKKAVLYTGGVKSWSIISALMDLGIEVVAVGTKKSTAEDEEKMRALLGPAAPLHENMAPKNIRALMREHRADILIAGGRNMYLAIKEGFPFVDVNQERHFAYAGYDGLVNLARQIDNSINFYKRASSGIEDGPVRTVQVKDGQKPSINPLRHSPSIGAAMAFQGVDRAAVVLHGAQGCNFLGKALLTKHFREPVSMVSTKLFVEDVVMGSEERLAKVVEEVRSKENPAIIGVLTTGLSEVKGDDIAMAFKGLDTGMPVIHVPTPDYKGGLEEGYALVVERLAALAKPGERNRRLVNILAGSALTPGDINEVKDTLGEFGLEAVVLPDLSAMDGGREGFSPLASGGTTLGQIRSMGTALVTIAIGPDMEKAGELLREKCGVPFTVFDSLTGIRNADRFYRLLSKAAGMVVPRNYQRDRRILIDGMRDAAVCFGGRKVALAQETGKALALSTLLSEMGVEVPLAVIPAKTEAAQRIIAEKILVGDFSEISGIFDLLVAGSHGAQAAEALGVPHMVWGFPVFDRLGFNASVNVGYKGTLSLINTIGNMLGGEK
jgi:nitrogenase molybdenum-cofactor synthesis protein NifE